LELLLLLLFLVGMEDEDEDEDEAEAERERERFGLFAALPPKDAVALLPPLLLSVSLLP